MNPDSALERWTIRLSSSMIHSLCFKFIPRGVSLACGDPVTFFGDQEHKRLDVPRRGSIKWIHTNCDVHGLERYHG